MKMSKKKQLNLGFVVQKEDRKVKVKNIKTKHYISANFFFFFVLTLSLKHALLLDELVI